MLYKDAWRAASHRKNEKESEGQRMPVLEALLVTPLTGPLALFGRASAQGLSLWTDSAANLPAPWQAVQLEVRNSGSDPAGAMRVALASRPDVVFGPYGSAPMRAVARVSDRVIWNHGGASASLTRPTFPRVINVISPATAYFTGVLEAVRASDPAASTVAFLHTTTGFGRDIAAGVQAAASDLNFAVHFMPFAPGQATTQLENVPHADILLVAGNFADEQKLAPALLERSWRAAAFVGAGVEEVLADLGERREGLLGPAQWLEAVPLQPDEGPDIRWFVTNYKRRFDTGPAYPAAQAFAAGLLFARCLRENGGNIDDEAQLAAANQLACTTLYGKFRLDPSTGLQAEHRVLLIQWQQNVRRVVWPPEYAERALHYPR